MAKKLVRLLRPQHPDAHYLKKVFQHTRALLDVGAALPAKRLPALLTDAELVAFYDAIWQARQLTHVVMLKLLLFTGIRNAELVSLRLTDVDLHTCQLRITQGKGAKDRYVLFPTGFRGELAQYVERQRHRQATYVFESNRHRPYSTRRLRQLVKQYAVTAGIQKRVYPHLFRHQLLTYLTKQGIISPKLQLLSGHTTEQSLAVGFDHRIGHFRPLRIIGTTPNSSALNGLGASTWDRSRWGGRRHDQGLAVYRELALSDVAAEYEAAMKTFPVR
jgi:integrase